MNIKSIFLSLSLLAINIPLLTSFSYNKIEAIEIDNIDKTIYVDISLNTKFLEDNSNPYISYKDNKINLIKNDNDDIYHTETILNKDIFLDSFEICSFNGEYKTVSIVDSPLKEYNYNYICLDTYIDSSLTSIKGYGYYDDIKPNPGATYKTQRVWLNNNNPYFYNNDEWGSPCKNIVGYYDNNKYVMVEMSSILLSSTSTLYYVDIPYNLTSFHFMRMSSSLDHSYIIYQDKYIPYISYGSCYYAGTLSYEDYLNISTTSINGANATILSLVVEAYLTYGKSDSNGCNQYTVKNLYNTWFKYKSASKDDLKSAKILDYSGYNKATGSYEGYEKTVPYSVNEKWNTMCSMAGINPDTGEASNSFLAWFSSKEAKAILIIGGIALVVVISVIIILLIKKKKEQD